MRTIPFFVMPGVALAHLREELEIEEGESKAKLMLYRYGQRCGTALVESYGLSCANLAEVRSVIEPVWMEAGLSRIRIDAAEEADMVVNMEDSIEAKEGCSYWCVAHLWIVPAHVEGQWKTNSGDLTLGQQFQMVSGMLHSSTGPAAVNGKLRGEQISFTAGKTTYSGRVNGRIIEGTMSSGGSASRWTATRSD